MSTEKADQKSVILQTFCGAFPRNSTIPSTENFSTFSAQPFDENGKISKNSNSSSNHDKNEEPQNFIKFIEGLKIHRLHNFHLVGKYYYKNRCPRDCILSRLCKETHVV